MAHRCVRPECDLESIMKMIPITEDKAAAGLIAVVAGLLALTGLLLVVWLANQLPVSTDAVPVELVAMSAGLEDGNPDLSPELDSLEEEFPDPAIAESSDTLTLDEFQMMLEIIVELSDSTSQQVDRAIQSAAAGGSGKVGGASDTARNTAGGEGTIGREQRWMIKFDEGDLGPYAKQLDFFKIELGALFKDGRLIFIKDMSKASPTRRLVQTGKGEDRLYMTWRGRSPRKQADAALFKKAGVLDAENAMLMHFYAPETEQLLARIESEYRNRKSSEIRATYFTVRKDGRGFKFVVISQSYLR